MYSQIKEIYELLSDDESRYTFIKKMEFSLNRSWEPIIELSKRIGKAKFDGIKTIVDVYQNIDFYEENEIILFGTGKWGNVITSILNHLNIQIAFYMDSNSDKVGTCFENKTILSVDEVYKNHSNAFIIIASEKYDNEMLEQLIRMGFCKDKIIRLKCFYRDMYFDTDIVLPGYDEIFVDAGCYDGDSTFKFIKWSNGNTKKIYAFEPDDISFERCKNNLSKNCSIKYDLIKAGLYSNTDILRFSSDGSEVSMVCDEGTNYISVKKLDEVVNVEDVITFIKMDIEGSELEALKGAKNTIQRCKPRLAICVYHKPEDILEIPNYIHKIMPDYRFYLRHYSVGGAETVLYAI